jgi:hypothetical protein
MTVDGVLRKDGSNSRSWGADLMQALIKLDRLPPKCPNRWRARMRGRPGSSPSRHPAWVAGRTIQCSTCRRRGSPQCSTSVSLVLTSITMPLISMFGGSTRYFARRSCSLMADSFSERSCFTR